MQDIPVDKEINYKWVFTDEKGSFEWKNPHTLNQLYFPICNEAGFMGSVTPRLHGDATTGQHTFLRLPLVIQDLHNTRSARNFWVYDKTLGAYSLTGNSAKQLSTLFTSEDKTDTTIIGTFLSHTLIREDMTAGIKSEITSFSPITEDAVEIMRIKITNISEQTLTLTPTTSLPIYGRSADSLRDHNHWTSLAHRIEMNDFGLAVKPAINHDERGHKPNHNIYFVAAVEENGEKPVGQFPTVAEFIGESGTFDWPQAVVENIPPYQVPPNRRDGMEAVGAIRFAEVTLAPGESKGYIVIEGVTQDKETVCKCIEKYGSSKKVHKALEDNHSYWQERVERISFETADDNFGKWMHWVALQPILRKIYGNSFLPHFDYGRGGRGWRDLWQDCLALLLQCPDEMKDTLSASFGGVRLDGSNATIIKKGLGKFAADRNKISRVWMDHGVWPYFTTKLYADQTGDIDIFFNELPYWKDHQIRRAKARDNEWMQIDGTVQKTTSGEVYTGSLIEHVLVQHLTCFHNVGDHNNMRLEDADWNDLLDLANEKGETVPFSAFYGWNLITIAELLLQYKKVKNIDSIKVFKELLTLTGLKGKVDYESPKEKKERLLRYFDIIQEGFSGQKAEVPIAMLAQDLTDMGNWVLDHVRNNEWIESKTGHGFFNGYYNNDGVRVDGDREDCTSMNLTAQTFAIMSGAATHEQVVKAFEAAKAILKDPNTGGFRLTTPLGPNTLNFGRGYAVVYGEKETGGTFNHMVVMFMNGLYRRGFVNEAYEVFKTIYELPNNTEKAMIYPGIPEYISHEGRGMYHYLSGSASWLLMTVLTQMFGFKGEYGELVIKPKLVKEQFGSDGKVKTCAFFLGKRIELTYINQYNMDYDEYKIINIRLNNNDVNFLRVDEKTAKIEKSVLKLMLKEKEINHVEVDLG
jgi:cellobiose phosphorylase